MLIGIDPLRRLIRKGSRSALLSIREGEVDSPSPRLGRGGKRLRFLFLKIQNEKINFVLRLPFSQAWEKGLGDEGTVQYFCYLISFKLRLQTFKADRFDSVFSDRTSPHHRPLDRQHSAQHHSLNVPVALGNSL
jgi:hypothetical protein